MNNPKHWWDMQQGRIKRGKGDPDPLQAFKNAVKLGAVSGDRMPPLKAPWADVSTWLKAREPLLPKPAVKPVVKPKPAPVALAANPAPVPEPAAPPAPAAKKPKKKRVKKAEVVAVPPVASPPPYPYPPPFYGYPPPPGYVPPPPAQLAPNPAPAPENPVACGCVWEESPHEREARRVRARAFGEWIEQVRALAPGDWSARRAVQAFEAGMAPEEFVKLHVS